MTTKHWTDDLNACPDAIKWAKQYPTLAAAWTVCARGDWMLWYLGKQAKTLEDRKQLVRIACRCARLALQYVPKGEERPLLAVKAAEDWCDSRISIKEVKKARKRAWTAYAAAADDADAAAAAAAADAADAADAAADAVDAAAYATSAAAASADATATADATTYAVNDYNSGNKTHEKTLSDCARIVREFVPKLE